MQYSISGFTEGSKIFGTGPSLRIFRVV